MFAKIVNDVVEVYPYDTKIDYPNTSFPVGFDYPSFDIYWVYTVAPNFDPLNFKAIEGDPVFNSETQKWEQSWNAVELSTEEKRLKRYNASQFMQEILDNALFKAWLTSFPPTDQMILLDAATNAKIDTKWTVVQVMYNAFKQANAPSVQAIAEWEDIAFRNGIPIVF